MNPQEASDAGLIDVVVPADQVLESAERKLAQYLKFDSNTWSATKLNLRKELIDSVSNVDEALMDKIIDHWYQPGTQAILNGFVEMLKKK